MDEQVLHSVLSPTATALLKSALLPPAEALVHWQRWTATQGFGRFSPTDTELLPLLFDPLTIDEQRLMPLVYRNLEKTNDRLIPHLRGIYRYTWMTNQRLLHRLSAIVTMLEARGIPTMILKGLPLSLHYYHDLGVRYMADADLLIPTDRADEAIAQLQTKPFDFQINTIHFRFRHNLHALVLHTADGTNLDIHRHLLFAHTYPQADTLFWANSQSITLPSGAVTRRLSDTDQLLHLLVHGYRWEQAPILRWIHDCHAVYAHPDAQIDWQYLLNRAVELRLTWPVQQNLAQLQRDWGLMLPADVAQRLAQLPVSATERAYFDLLNRRATHWVGAAWRFWQKNQRHYNLFLQGKPNQSRVRFILGQFGLQLDLSMKKLIGKAV